MPSITFEQDGQERVYRKKKGEADRLLGREFFLYEDDREFIANDSTKYGEILNALKRDVTKIVYARFRQTVENVMNIIITIFGPPGTGKSVCGLTIACMLQYYYLSLGQPSRIHLCFSDWEINEAIKIATAGDILVQDERPIIHGAGAKITTDSINNIRKAVRAKRINYVGITPNEMMDVTVNLKFETLGYDKKTGMSRMLVRGGRNNTLLGHCYFKKFLPEELNKEYEALKMKNIDDLLEAGGASTQSGKREAEKLKKDAEQVIAYIRDNNIPLSEQPNKMKAEIKPLLSMAGIDNPSNSYKANLIQYILIMKKMEKMYGTKSLGNEDEDVKEGDEDQSRFDHDVPEDREFEDEEDDLEEEKNDLPSEPPIKTTALNPREQFENGFVFDMVHAFDKVKMKEKEAKITRFQLAYAGKSPEEIFNIVNTQSPSVDTSAVSLDQIRKDIRSIAIVVQRELGYQWEDYCEQKYKKMGGVASVKHGKLTSDPDFEVEFTDGSYFIINAKATSTSDAEYEYFSTKFQPELQRAKQLQADGKQVKLFLHFYNTHHRYEEMVEIDLNNPRKIAIRIGEKNRE